MKKILFLLLCTVSMYGQTLQNPTFGTLRIKNNVATASTDKIVSQQDVTGELNYIDAINLPISSASINADNLRILKTDFYTETDVNYPAEITSRLFKITEQNGIFKTDKGVDDLVKDKISKMKPYYCNYETGSNSNDGLTPATAVKTVTYAYVTLGARLLYLTGGIHKGDSWGMLNSSFTNTDDFFVLQYGEKRTYLTNTPSTAPTYSLQSGTTYQFTLANTANVIDMKYKDKKGFPFRMVLQTSIALVNANAGSFFISGTTVYINTIDGRAPDASILPLLAGVDTASYSANAGYHYTKGLTFLGGSAENGTHGVISQSGSNSTLVNLAKDCIFLYGQDVSYTSNGGEGTRNLYNKYNIYESCIAYGNSRDGFNYLSDAPGSNKMYVLEINNQAFQNGERQLSSSVNGSSAHGICEVVRVNGKYYANSGPNVADVDGSITVNYGVKAFNSISLVANDKTDFNTNTGNGIPSRQYNYKCVSLNNTIAFRVGSTQESYIINKDCYYVGSLVISNPSAPQTITFVTDFPTANAVSPVLPVLSAYIANVDYAPLASPNFTGNPTAPTPTAGDNDTSIANTFFVTGAIATADASSVKTFGNQNIEGTKTVNNSLTTPSKIAFVTQSNATDNTATFATGSTTYPALLVNAVNAGTKGIKALVTSGGSDAIAIESNSLGAGGASSNMIVMDNVASGNDITPIRVKKQGVEVMKVDYLGNVTAPNLPIQLKDFYADVNNTSTTETDLLTYTTVANRLNAIGEKLVSTYGGSFNDLTATNQLKAYFGGVLIGDTGALTITFTGAWVINLSIIRTGASTARAIVNISTPGASTASYTKYTALTGLTFTGTNIIKITGTAGGGSGGSNDITASYGNITWQPAAL